ncbi:ATP-binding protein [Marinagarivorans algicola]|uniref:ATP-binding protein n=1 Tax=Marinagarivorans algicola TaxID=1513270 RepID=UPI0006B4C9D2|nr:SbcC/MukB-like Walker B domain-containing protein [Marinagarivorans algicola]
MFCKRLVLVNWGNIPSQEIDFGPINLLSGGNGSGKTTAADALQSLMTAAHENLFNYNPGQDETTQRGRGGKQVRTLASYVLGCDDGSYARLRTTDGYIAGIFHPTSGETADPFTAVMCIRASLDTAGSNRQARQEDLQFLIIPNETLALDDFVREDTAGKYIVPMNDLPNLLKKKFSTHSSVEVYDKKGPYLRRLYGIFRNDKDAVPDREAKHAARTFSNFMAYKPVKSITDFVAREILEPKDLTDDIRQVSELMKTIHSMEEDTRHVNEAVENLSEGNQQAQIYIDNWIEGCVAQYAEQARLFNAKQNDYLAAKKEQGTIAQTIKDNQLHRLLVADKKTDLQQEHIELLAQRQGISALKDKDQLQSDISKLNTQLADYIPDLMLQDAQFTKNVHAAERLSRNLSQQASELDIPALASKKINPILAPVLKIGSNTGIDANNLQTKDWVNNAALEEKLGRIVELEAHHNKTADWLHTGENSPANQIYLMQHRKAEQLEKIKQQTNQKNLEVQRLQHQKVSYPAQVEQAIKAITDQCPQAEPAVLCDFIEVTDPKWQMAIEGYLGGARFSIVVSPDWEAEAINIVRALPGRRSNARVLQGAKAQHDANKLTLPKNSIVDVMRFDHKIVEYYIRASYGAVIRVKDNAALKNTARGLTAEGVGSGNYSLFRCDIDEADLVFGQGARERALIAKETQLQNLQKQANTLALQYQQLLELHQCISDIQLVNCSTTIKNMLNIYRQLQKVESQLASLDLKDFTALEERLEDLKNTLQELEDEAKTCSEEFGSLRTREEQNARLIKRLASEKDALHAEQETCEAQVHAIAKIYADFNAEAALKHADDEAKGKNSFAVTIAQCAQRSETCERKLYEHIVEHNRTSAEFNAISYSPISQYKHDAQFFAFIVKIQEELGRIYSVLKNNVLVSRYEKLVSLKDSFNTTFVTSLCHSIYQSINDGKRTLDDLNKELKHHRFGADRESFYFDYAWVPEFKEYWGFFKEIINSPELGEGANLFNSKLSDKSAVVRDKLLSMLLDKGEHNALTELRRISDYRNYRHYEIFKEPEGKQPIALSTYGTGSGGQLETPAYIIRSAAITSAFKFNEGKSHCRMVLVDEAFSKMDETRSREVINYLTETLGLQLIFIMPSSKSGPFMDLISHQVVFSKCPTTEPVGELNTRVLVDRKVCNPDKIKDLWAKHRRTIRHQATLDFMDGIA